MSRLPRPSELPQPDPAALAGLVLGVLKYVSYACLAFCLVGLSLSVRRTAPLWAGSLRAEGQVVGFHEIAWQGSIDGTARTESARLPIVVFRDALNHPRTFTDAMAHGEVMGQAVPVLYAKGDPSTARIDRGPLNLLEPAIWLFGFLGGLLGAWRLSGSRGLTLQP